MATISYGGNKPSYQYRGSASGGKNPTIEVGFEDASQSFKVGDLLKYVSGKLRAFGTGVVNSGTLIAGFANQAASGTTDTPIEFTVPDTEREYWLPCCNGSGTLTAGAITDIGTCLRGYNSATYGLCVDNTTAVGVAGVFQVIGIVTTPNQFYASAAATDTGVLYKVKFVTAGVTSTAPVSALAGN